MTGMPASHCPDSPPGGFTILHNPFAAPSYCFDILPADEMADAEMLARPSDGQYAMAGEKPGRREKAMKALILAIMLAAVLAAAGTSTAVPPGKTADWDTPMGKVTFDGQKHKDAGLNCMDCHPNVFKMKGGSFDAKMADHNEGKNFCWSCHNGTRAFTPQGNCAKCHVK